MSGVRFFVISKNCLVVTDRRGIWLYHIPELRAAREDTRLVAVWDLPLDASDYRGTLYKTTFAYPGLWLQRKQTTHTIEFDADGFGYPMVENHHTAEGKPGFHMGNTLKLQGRKGMSIETLWRDEVMISTGVLGKPDTRRLRAPIPGLNRGPRVRQAELKYADLDEMTGRIMIVVGPEVGRGQVDVPYARRLYIADIPN